MSQLKTVWNALESRPDVSILRYPRKDFTNEDIWHTNRGAVKSPDKPFAYDRPYESDMAAVFWVAPRKKLHPEELQDFMIGLIPLKPAYVSDFVQHGDTLELGKLYFHEEFPSHNNQDNVCRRTVSVRVFPNEAYLRKILDPDDKEIKFEHVARLKALDVY